MCDKAVKDDRCQLKYVLDYFKTQKLCEKAVEKNPYAIKFVRDHLTAPEISEKAVKKKLIKPNTCSRLSQGLRDV